MVSRTLEPGFSKPSIGENFFHRYSFLEAVCFFIERRLPFDSRLGCGWVVADVLVGRLSTWVVLVVFCIRLWNVAFWWLRLRPFQSYFLVFLTEPNHKEAMQTHNYFIFASRFIAIVENEGAFS